MGRWVSQPCGVSGQPVLMRVAELVPVSRPGAGPRGRYNQKLARPIAALEGQKFREHGQVPAHELGVLLLVIGVALLTGQAVEADPALSGTTATLGARHCQRCLAGRSTRAPDAKAAALPGALPTTVRHLNAASSASRTPNLNRLDWHGGPRADRPILTPALH
jgi:hypothetical protein